MKKSKKLIKTLQPFWKRFKELESQYHTKIAILETEMEDKIKIKGIEFYFCDGECAGIGTVDRKLKLIHNQELEEGKIINYE